MCSSAVADQTASSTLPKFIEIQGARVHHLKNLNVQIPLQKWTAVTGVSGAGKSSLVFDTLYAESQRRFLETLPNSARYWLEAWERPDVDQIFHLPASIAVGLQQQPRTGIRRLSESAGIENLLVRIALTQGSAQCPNCSIGVPEVTPESIVETLSNLPAGLKFQIAFPVFINSENRAERHSIIEKEKSFWEAAGFHRYIEMPDFDTDETQESFPGLLVIVDRLVTGQESRERLNESLEQATKSGLGEVCALFSVKDREQFTGFEVVWPVQDEAGRDWIAVPFLKGDRCSQCFQRIPSRTPQLFDATYPEGACESCQGAGTVSKRKSVSVCPSCDGLGLNSISRSYRISDSGAQAKTFEQLLKLTINELSEWSKQTDLNRTGENGIVSDQLSQTLDGLMQLGLGELQLSRLTRSLSRGEYQRLAMISLVEQGLVHALFLFEEITNGLHPLDRKPVIEWIRSLVEAGNTVVTVEHHADVIAAADSIIELGPDAGRSGGGICFQGTPADFEHHSLLKSDEKEASVSVTAFSQPENWMKLVDVSINNLDGVSVEIPVNRLVVVTGVCGSGKTSLVCGALAKLAQDQVVEKEAKPEKSSKQRSALDDPFRSGLKSATLEGLDGIDECVAMYETDLTGSSRSTPAKFMKAFDEIRKLFAETVDAQARGFKPARFSFNSAQGGRCLRCQGRGELEMDMQFLANLKTICPECHGTRYSAETLAVAYRNRNIHEVLSMTVDEAFAFFRNHPKVLRPLQHLRDVGMGYLALGQPTATLSQGERQRLQLAAYLNSTSGRQVLFLFDEPASGLHPRDIETMLKALRRLVEQGHSVVIIENEPQVHLEADWVIELGPGAGKSGGKIITAAAPQ